MNLSTEAANRRLRRVLTIIKDNPGSDAPALRTLGANLNAFRLADHDDDKLRNPLVMLEASGRAGYDSNLGWQITDTGLEFLMEVTA